MSNLNNSDTLNIPNCFSFIETHGHPLTQRAAHKFKNHLNTNIVSIQFWWYDAKTVSDRAICIRGALRRIVKNNREKGRCSNQFKALYQIKYQ